MLYYSKWIKCLRLIRRTSAPVRKTASWIQNKWGGKRYLLQRCSSNVCISALEPRAEGPGVQQDFTKVLISRRVEDKNLRVKREQRVPSALRSGNF